MCNFVLIKKNPKPFTVDVLDEILDKGDNDDLGGGSNPNVKLKTVQPEQIIGTIEGDWLPKGLLSSEDADTVLQQVNFLSG